MFVSTIVLSSVYGYNIYNWSNRQESERTQKISNSHLLLLTLLAILSHSSSKLPLYFQCKASNLYPFAHPGWAWTCASSWFCCWWKFVTFYYVLLFSKVNRILGFRRVATIDLKMTCLVSALSQPRWSLVIMKTRNHQVQKRLRVVSSTKNLWTQRLPSWPRSHTQLMCKVAFIIMLTHNCGFFLI